MAAQIQRATTYLDVGDTRPCDHFIEKTHDLCGRKSVGFCELTYKGGRFTLYYCNRHYGDVDANLRHPQKVVTLIGNVVYGKGGR